MIPNCKLVGRAFTLKRFHRETPHVAPDFCGVFSQDKQNTHATFPFIYGISQGRVRAIVGRVIWWDWVQGTNIQQNNHTSEKYTTKLNSRLLSFTATRYRIDSAGVVQQ